MASKFVINDISNYCKCHFVLRILRIAVSNFECRFFCCNIKKLFFYVMIGDLTPSQFPVFTIYVQKTCLKSASKCGAAWSFERVMNHEIAATEISRSQQTERAPCMETCLLEDKCRYVAGSQKNIEFAAIF